MESCFQAENSHTVFMQCCTCWWSADSRGVAVLWDTQVCFQALCGKNVSPFEQQRNGHT